MSMQIRQACLTDVDALLTLEKICFDSDQLSRKQFNYLIQSKTVVVLVIAQEIEIIAHVILLFRKNSKIARCYSIAVAPFLRGKGIGQLLLQSIEHEACLRQASCMQLEVKKNNHKAIHFYQQAGYEIFGEYTHYYQGGEDAFRMRKPLQPSNNMKLK